MLDAYAAIANNGVMMKPYVVKSLETADGRVVKEFEPKKIRRVCSVKTAKRMTELMKWVVEKGTGTAVALPSYDIAGKTGTAYKFMNGHYSKYNYVSSFIGFVPAQNPKFVIYVSLDDPRGIYWGGYTAGPVFKEVAKRALVYDLVPGNDPTTLPAQAGDKHSVPSFAGLTPSQCKWLAQDHRLKVKFDGKGQRIVAQSQPAGTPLSTDPKQQANITLTLGEPESNQSSGQMPNLDGKTKRQALALLAPLGVHVNFKGEGVVRSQFPSPGRTVTNNTPCELNCEVPVAKTDAAPSGGNS
jgi:membrane peptidoglycan carboxypeptidase